MQLTRRPAGQGPTHPGWRLGRRALPALGGAGRRLLRVRSGVGTLWDGLGRGGKRTIASLITSSLLLAGCSTSGGHSLAWGVYVPDDGSPSSDLTTVAAMAGRPASYVERFAALGESVPVKSLNTIVEAGATPVLTLEPWIPGQGADQPDFALAKFAAGKHDADLRRWARGLAKWDKPLLLRFAHELNGTWYPWAVSVNGNTAADYVRAWRHLRGALREAGADRVSLVWTVNAPFPGSADFTAAFPGAHAVDYLGIDGYNWAAGDGQTWQNPDALFQAGLDQLRALPGNLPILVTELASSQREASGKDKARWIRDCIDLLSHSDRVVGLIWFQATKERDWRFNSSAASEAALKESLAGLPH